MIMLSSIFPNFRKFKNSVDHVPNIQKLQKLCKSDFSYTRFWYYSRVELLCNFPQEEFMWQGLATGASLQRPLDNQILTLSTFSICQPGYLWYNILCQLRDCQKDCSHHWIMICKGWIYQRYQEPSSVCSWRE